MWNCFQIFVYILVEWKETNDDISSRIDEGKGGTRKKDSNHPGTEREYSLNNQENILPPVEHRHCGLNEHGLKW